MPCALSHPRMAAPLRGTLGWVRGGAGRRSTCGRKLGSRIARLHGHPRHLGAGVWAEPLGAGQEAWAGGGADTER